MDTQYREDKWRRNFDSTYQRLHFSRYIRQSGQHLDFGCGIGVFTYLLAKRHPGTMFYGTDIDSEMISIAKNRYRAKNLNFNPVQGIEYDSMSFIYMLHHIPRPKAALKRILKDLKDGGKVFILEFRKTPKEIFSKVYEMNEPAHCFDEYYKVHNRWTKEQFEKMCKDVGLKTLELQDYDEFWFAYVGEKNEINNVL